MSSTEVGADSPPHLRKDKPPNRGTNGEVAGEPFGIRTEREFFCERCKARVTLGTDGTAEYGHDRSCRHYIGRDR